MERTKPTPVLDWFKATANKLENDEVKQFKANGGKVVGMFYPDTPLELLEAAGCMGFSLRGNTADGTDLADAYFKNLTCEYTRATSTSASKGSTGSSTAPSGSITATTCAASTTTGRPATRTPPPITSSTSRSIATSGRTSSTRRM